MDAEELVVAWEEIVLLDKYVIILLMEDSVLSAIQQMIVLIKIVLLIKDALVAHAFMI
jgi:hypothetical protein